MKNNLKVALSLLLAATTAHAESELNFAKTTQNPLAINPEARYFTLPFVGNMNAGYGPQQNTQATLDLKPVMPFRFTRSLDVIFRTIAPLVHQPGNNGYINGIGDINPTMFIAPAENSPLLYGIGPTVMLPTATNTALGAGKWSIGPELALVAMPDMWTLAILTNNMWSVAGDPNRANVNQFTFQYFITYNLPHGWYITSQPTITANWQAAPRQKWTIPFGVGGGRAFHIGKQAMSFSMQSYFYAVRPSHTSYWTLQANFEFLFPDHRTL